MSDPLSYIAQRITLEHQTRVQLLRKHGWTGVAVGVLVLSSGGNRTIEEWVGTWTRLGLGASALVAGLLLVWATRDYSEDVKRLRFQRWSTLTLAGWDLTMTAGIVGSIVLYQGPWEVTLPWHPSPRWQPILFPIAIYIGRGAVALLLHSRAIARVLREKS